MSRTVRRLRPKFWRHRALNKDLVQEDWKKRRVRDGEPQYVSVHCEHNNACSYCRNNRTFSSRRRAPLEVS